MWTRKLLKDNAKIALTRNYWTCVLVSFLAVLLGGGMTIGVNFQFNKESAESTQTQMLPLKWEEIQLLLTLFIIILVIALIVVIAIATFVSNVVTVGNARYFMENREHKTGVTQLFYGFQEGRYMKIVKTMFLQTLYLLGWTLLFVIPGIVKMFSYLLVPYILAENPNLDSKRAIELSRKMMDGHKMEAFVLQLSFLGWAFLGSLTGGILHIFMSLHI